MSQNRPGPQGPGTTPSAPLLFSFSRDLKRAMPPIRVHLPKLYPGYHWEFNFRVALSGDMKKKREEWLALPLAQMNEKEDDEVFAEACDLLASDPTGFADYPADRLAPGEKLKMFAQGIVDPVGQELLRSILRAAISIYWANVTPREYFPPPSDNSAAQSGSQQTTEQTGASVRELPTESES